MHTSSRASALALALLSLSIVACSGDEPVDTGSDSSSAVSSISDEPLQPIQADRNDRDSTAQAILESFARSEWQILSELSSPMGVRFTPSTYVNVDTDQTLTQTDIAAFGTDETTRLWGVEEGSGFPITMTNTEYLARYVWDQDYRTAPDVRWNAAQDRGSMIDNVQDVYPGASVVEYHFPGFDPQYGGMDWRSLRLVLAQNDDAQWTLYGVIHDEWTP